MNPTGHSSVLRARRGFTIVELAVVVVIISVLVTVLLFAMGNVLRSSEVAGAENQLRAISDATEMFQNDLGYYPPVLGFDDATWEIGDEPPAGKRIIVPESLNPPATASSRVRQARYGSEYTIAVYLLGAGDINGRVGDSSSAATSTPNPGANNDFDDGAAGPGIRAPGPDRSWGGAADRSNHAPSRVGRVYGPYLDQASVSEQMRLEPQTGLFKIVDVWGQPIRYYHGWPTLDPTTRTTSLARVPVELRSGEGVQAQIDNNGQADLAIERPALNSRFMLVSAGRPVEFRGDGSAFPTFGDRNYDENPNDTTGAPMVQNLSMDFNPMNLSETEREYLIERLLSNIRVAR